MSYPPPPPHYSDHPQHWRPVSPGPGGKPPHLRGSISFTVIAFIVIGLGALIMGLNFLVMSVVVPLGTILGSFLALIPLSLLIWYYLKLDSGEAEGRRLLLYALAWGALGATGFAVILNTIGAAIGGQFFGIVVVAPVAEEIMKGAFLFLLFWTKRHVFDGVIDGLIYAGFVGMGFAFAENITYFTSAYGGLSLSTGEITTDGGLGLLMATFLARTASCFLHPVFTSMTGIGLGLALTSGKNFGKLLYPVVGLLCAMVLHSAWNFFAITASPVLTIIIYGGVFFPLLVGYFFYAHHQKKKQVEALTAAVVDLMAMGALTEEEAYWLGDKTRRKAALAFALRYGGERGLKDARDYQQSAFSLVLLHARALASIEGPDAILRGREYFKTMKTTRPRIAFPPRGVPFQR